MKRRAADEPSVWTAGDVLSASENSQEGEFTSSNNLSEREPPPLLIIYRECPAKNKGFKVVTC
jgi:hypothetical protein